MYSDLRSSCVLNGFTVDILVLLWFFQPSSANVVDFMGHLEKIMIENSEFCVTSENVEVQDTIFFIKNFKGLSEHSCMHAHAHRKFILRTLCHYLGLILINYLSIGSYFRPF